MRALRILVAVVFVVPVFADRNRAPRAVAAKKLWTMDDVYYGRAKDPQPEKPIDYCQGGRFLPCVCIPDVPNDLIYLPALQECDGKAAILLGGKFNGVYSAVVRDTENRDRWPPAGFNGCTQSQADTGADHCSAFKSQKDLFSENLEETKHYKVSCLGASGYSTLFQDVVRITIKIKDIPDSDDDPLYRACIVPNKPLNWRRKKTN